MNASAQSYFDTDGKASRDEANTAIRKLSEHSGIHNVELAASLALVRGVLVEGW